MKMELSDMNYAVTGLAEINEDNSVPRNVRAQIQGILETLRNEVELPIKVNKALNILGELSNDVNLQGYTRTQIWNIMSILEKL